MYCKQTNFKETRLQRKYVHGKDINLICPVSPKQLFKNQSRTVTILIEFMILFHSECLRILEIRQDNLDEFNCCEGIFICNHLKNAWTLNDWKLTDGCHIKLSALKTFDYTS